jgi:hypothetical protein
VARAAAKGGKRQSANARRQQQQRAAVAQSPSRRRLSKAEQNLFFSRIRRQAKWAYVLLAVLFAVTFAALGVGSGQGGLQNFFSNIFSSSGGSSISKLQSQTEKHPRDAGAWKQLAVAYAGKQRNEDAVNAMAQYTQLRPNDAAGWSQLGQFQSTAAATNAQLYAFAQSQASSWQTATYNPLTPTGKLAGATASDPIQQGVQSQLSQAQSLASNLQTTAKSQYVQALASLQHAARLTPGDPTGWNNVVLQGINAMRSIGTDPALAKPALAAYTKLKALDPTTAAQYKQFLPTLKQLAGGTGR